MLRETDDGYQRLNGVSTSSVRPLKDNPMLYPTLGRQEWELCKWRTVQRSERAGQRVHSEYSSRATASIEYI